MRVWFFTLIVLAACSAAPRAGPPGTATVVRVIDGDTVVVHIDGKDEHVRLIGIDTPETVDPDKPVMCYGAEASAKTKSLLPPGTTVRLVRDIEARDAYGRLLAYVYRAGDGAFINLALAAGGYADELRIAPNTAHSAEFHAAVAAARAARVGLWGACGEFGTPAG